MERKGETSDGFLEAIQKGTIENLQRLAVIEAPEGVMNAEELKDFLKNNSIVESLSAAVVLNELASGTLPETIRPGSIAQYFDCGFSMGVDPHNRDIVTGISKVCFKGGRRNNVHSDRRGLFDYEYSLELPVKDYISEDFRLDSTHPIQASYSAHNLKMNYNTETSRHCVGSGEFTSLLHEVIGDLIVSIERSDFRQQEKEKLASRISSLILHPDPSDWRH